jgi:hypothetical protein
LECGYDFFSLGIVSTQLRRDQPCFHYRGLIEARVFPRLHCHSQRLPFDGSRSFSTSVDDTLRPSQFTYKRIRINAGYFPLAYSHGQNCLLQENCKPKPVHVEAPLQHVCRYPGYPSRLIWIGGGRRRPIFGKRKYISWTKRRQRSIQPINRQPGLKQCIISFWIPERCGTRTNFCTRQVAGVRDPLATYGTAVQLSFSLGGQLYTYVSLSSSGSASALHPTAVMSLSDRNCPQQTILISNEPVPTWTTRQGFASQI